MKLFSQVGLQTSGSFGLKPLFQLTSHESELKNSPIITIVYFRSKKHGEQYLAYLQNIPNARLEAKKEQNSAQPEDKGRRMS